MTRAPTPPYPLPRSPNPTPLHTLGLERIPFLIINSVVRCTLPQWASHLRAPLLTYHVVQLVWHLWFGGSCPFGSTQKVILNEWPICPIFKETCPPCHRRLNDFIANHQQYVPWHGSVHAWEERMSLWAMSTATPWDSKYENNLSLEGWLGGLNVHHGYQY